MSVLAYELKPIVVTFVQRFELSYGNVCLFLLVERKKKVVFYSAFSLCSI